MKIRNGFVSNSSSSSFILKLPHFPASYEDMKEMLLGDENPLVLTHYGNEAFPTRQVVDIIYNDIVNALKSSSTKNTVNSISAEDFEVSEYNMDQYDKKVISKYKERYNQLKRKYNMVKKDINDFYNLDRNKRDDKLIDSLYDRQNDISQEMGEIIKMSIDEQSLNTDLFVTLSYSDNDGSIMAYIEHGSILDPITVSRISHH